MHHPGIAKITLFASNPDLVTPTGIAVAPDGRVFVQENHTHQRQNGYGGPPRDRLLVFEDLDHDGVADRHAVFHEGLEFSTDLLFGPGGDLFATNRYNVYRFAGAATKAKSGGEPELLVKCVTEGSYPHNGVSGLALDAASPEWLHFGFGENLGFDYTFVGSDGTRISGGGEGGSTYRCRLDGSRLERLSTGHWNTFGMAFDLHGNLFCTDNDPGSCPPNRLLHVIEGADFGYEYRYGRSGLHPLVTWTGEFAGTLGMVGGLGEAASGIVPFGPGRMLVASWSDNRVDLHPLTPKGASFSAGREEFITGPDDFRPVHFAYAPDSRFLYITDWVDSSYPVHGRGRIWRVEFRKPVDLAPRRRKQRVGPSPAEALDQLGSPDPYLRTEAIRVLVKHPDTLAGADWKKIPDPVARAHFAVALKRSLLPDAATVIPGLLADPDEQVRFVAVKWIGDERRTEYRSLLEAQLDRQDLSARSFRAVMAALQRLEPGDRVSDSPAPRILIGILNDSAKPASLRALALRLLPSGYKKLPLDRIRELAGSPHPALRLEAVRTLQQHPDPNRCALLAGLAADSALPPELRAEAIVGLASFAGEKIALLKSLAGSGEEAVAAEAARALIGVAPHDRVLETKPPFTAVADWVALVESAPGETDPAAGRRLFFHPRLGACSTCHQMDGRGTRVGPDLTTIHRQEGINRTWLLEHILNPNALVAPQFMPWQMTMQDDSTHLGFVLQKAGGTHETYLGIDGRKLQLRRDQIVGRLELPMSLMPAGLLHLMTPGEIRDLLAYLMDPFSAK